MIQIAIIRLLAILLSRVLLSIPRVFNTSPVKVLTVDEIKIRLMPIINMGINIFKMEGVFKAFILCWNK
jgi:hypothetical protein